LRVRIPPPPPPPATAEKMATQKGFIDPARRNLSRGRKIVLTGKDEIK